MVFTQDVESQNSGKATQRDNTWGIIFVVYLGSYICTVYNTQRVTYGAALLMTNLEI